MALVAALLVPGCEEDEAPAAPEGPAVGKVAGTAVDFQFIEIRLRGYPQGARVILRAGIYWSPSQLQEDPLPAVTRVEEALFRVDFDNLARDKFIAPDAEILLAVVDSAAKELSGVVVLCSELGPIVIDPSCAGDCAPECGVPGHDCDGP